MAESADDARQKHDSRQKLFRSGAYVERDTYDVLKHLRWYYADNMMNMSVHGELCDNPQLHADFLNKHDLWRQDMPRWLCESAKAVHEQLVPILDAESLSEFVAGKDVVWAHVVAQNVKARTAADEKVLRAFANVWTVPGLFVPFPADLVLFEGQPGQFDEDYADMLHSSPGDVIERAGPTVATWSLNAAGWGWPSDNSDAVLVVHHIQDPAIKAFAAQELNRRGFDSPWMKCQIALQPGLRIAVVAQTFDMLDNYSQGRSALRRLRPRRVRVLHTKVELSKVERSESEDEAAVAS
jgi:hypothetical protein